ncbi:unnamed protein product [Saimiriine gammaherpesvirus 2]|uniref:Uncharacterized gene 52 protein n=1 Tax=Saimiriine herpesvirus 2 (strain 11) TaxID=10383 RepID=VG52_SHV21|nr:unnamed protein product [Saimiriine gammaherpesvirus 2]Q01050.1 RecName: Full=Uncharacterized gene 52 protein [Herpesvirus saimiri (strain 11)]pir/E36811/ hypothetical protein ORF52 - saimiriine herpesvirus 1 (strain 11) [Saimiriine alphaherpesvirus 1]AAA46129.1 first methionine codon in the EDLF3 ORF [Saimiriine gammaherpesvirus 2]CAA45675.1 unnamed protein product [Saimiriine gammaherpesvirus 2]
MASRRSCADVEELEKELQKLKIENKALKKKLVQHTSPEDELLTPAQKDAIINSTVNKLTKKAEEKIRERVLKDVLPLVSKNQCMEAIAHIKYRIDVSIDETYNLSRRPASKPRTK